MPALRAPAARLKSLTIGSAASRRCIAIPLAVLSVGSLAKMARLRTAESPAEEYSAVPTREKPAPDHRETGLGRLDVDETARI